MILQRVITALVLVPMVILAIFGLTIELFAVVIGALISLAAWEWSAFFIKRIELRVAYTASVAGLMLAIAYTATLPMAYWNGYMMPLEWYQWFVPNQLTLAVLLLGNLWWLAAFVMLLIFPRISQRLVIQPVSMIVIGWLILIPTWVAVVGIRSMSIEFDLEHGPKLLLFVLLIIWAADTGAFAAGKTLGKHKLAPAVSPKKTWEGVIGGALLSVAVYAVGLQLLHFPREQWYPLLGLTLMIVFLSVVGDLTESIFKRLTGIKDSGKILPGHGGILDRIDGVTAALPFTLLAFSFLGIN